MSITGYDHLAITVADIEATTLFYDRLFGIRRGAEYAPSGRPLHRQIFLGDTKLNLHQQGNGVDLVAKNPIPGSADVCFRWSRPIETAVALLTQNNVAIVDGPSPRSLSDGRPSKSVYFRDPDGNLIELMAAL
jgi:catechol 2,3-dioxygenase-like lactoylglutathione lyase family enzyme